MTFALVCIGMIVGLGVTALIANKFDKGEDVIQEGHDCSTCTSAQEGDCKIHCLIKENEERKKKEVARNKTYDELWDPDEDIKI
jgi:hypothetical protein